MVYPWLYLLIHKELRSFLALIEHISPAQCCKDWKEINGQLGDGEEENV